MPATYVPPKKPVVGEPEAALFGEQPGNTEVKRGEPFIGPTKSVLDECFGEANLQRNAIYLSNIIKDLDRELSYYIQFKKNGPHISDAGKHYLEQVENEIQKLNCTVIIAVGNVALYALTGRVGITKWRGSILPCALDETKWVIPIVHPATVLPPKFQYLNKHLIKFDLVRARRLIDGNIEFPERKIAINPAFDTCMDYLNECEQLGKQGHLIFYDIEVYNDEVSCISFSFNKYSGISIPFIDNNGDFFPPNQETDIWLTIARILENPDIRKGGQNLPFDAHFLLRRYGIRTKNCDDTMICNQVLLPEYPKGLDFITSIWTIHPYYKDEGKRWFKLGGKWEQLWHYNALDSIVCAEAFPNQWESLVNQGNTRTYERQRLMIEPLVFMQEHGIKTNVEGMKQLKQNYQEKVDEMQQELNELAGRSLNPQSPKQLVDYFYFEKRFKSYKNKQGGYSTDDTAMKRLVRKGSREAELVRSIRSYKKLMSNYLNVDKVSNDGRMRCSYNPVGTRYARISSSESIFGEGMNMQNWPHDMLQFLYPDDEQVFYSFDLSQAENRIVAYVGRIDQMIEAFETGKDVHALTGALISGKTPEQVKEDDKNEIPCSLGDGTKTWRFWGKKANHGLNYDLGFKTFALYYEIPERDAKFIVDKYHKAYPGVRQGYHSFVKSQLAKNRTLENLMGRKTIFLDQWGDSLLKEAYSCIPQGTTGDLINERGILFTYYNQNQFKPIALLNQVHDSVGFQIPLTCPWTEHAQMLLSIKNELEKPLTTYYGDTFYIPADLTMACSLWKEGHGDELKAAKIPDDVNEFAKLLEKTYGEIYEKTYGA